MVNVLKDRSVCECVFVLFVAYDDQPHETTAIEIKDDISSGMP